ncbi:L-methionine gamma-lyase-like [Diadema setosum]|uniref:L-methionine gamma-lyase-like n=1 Tax=Diadema setosum TaxID=31175 RepID=UPI003B3A9E78
MADAAIKPKSRVRTTFTVGRDGDIDLSRTLEDTRDYPPGVTMETVAVTAQTKLRGSETTRPVVPSISVATTFEMDKVDDYMQYTVDGYIYGRMCNHSCDVVSHAVNKIEGGVGALVYPSGMSAISTTILALIKSGDHVIAPDPVYAGVYTFMKHMIPNYGVEVTFVPAGDVEAYRKAIKPNTKLFYGETPTNPILTVLDLEEFAKVAKSVPGAISMCDSTFASPYLQNTLAAGVDIVFQSCTKYMGGHSDLMGGSMSTSDPELFFYLSEHQKQIGNIMSPYTASLLLRGIRTLPLRMEKHSNNALRVAQYLEAHPKVSRVYYPGLQSHPNHEVAKKQMKQFSGMVVFEMADGLDAAKTFVESVKIILLAVSLGSTESLVEHPATMTHGPYLMTKEERLAGGISDGLIRLSVGIENADDLIMDLEQALGKA